LQNFFDFFVRREAVLEGIGSAKSCVRSRQLRQNLARYAHNPQAAWSQFAHAAKLSDDPLVN